jgi:ubiquitin fusion degradation protein 1
MEHRYEEAPTHEEHIQFDEHEEKFLREVFGELITQRYDEGRAENGENDETHDFLHPDNEGREIHEEKCPREVSGELISQSYDEERAENGENGETNDFLHPNSEGRDLSDNSSNESEENSNDVSNQSSQASDEYSSNESDESSSDISDQSYETSDEGDDNGVSPDSFEQIYHCYPLSQIEKSLPENGDKIIMPTSALIRLLRLEIQYPMQFEIRSESSGQVSHCGVLEFTGEEDAVFLPGWMMENMQLQENDRLIVKNVSLERGTYMKLQPHTTDFIHVSDIKDFLEDILRNFSCLTTGDNIMINHNSKKFYVNIVETKPSAAINIIDTDCEVEFATPLDYKEPEKPAPKIAAPVEHQKLKAKFIPFQGLARRLDGESTAAPELSSELKQQALDTMATRPNLPSRRLEGKLVFGSRESQPMKKVSEDDVQGEAPKEEEHQFRPFTGKKYKLTD